MDAPTEAWRPDADFLEEDCLHSCLPGPTDEYVRLLYNLVLAMRDTTNAAHGTTSAAYPPQRHRRFFEDSLSSWLHGAGAEHLEPCADAGGPDCAYLSAAQGLTHCAPWSALPTKDEKGRPFKGLHQRSAQRTKKQSQRASS